MAEKAKRTPRAPRVKVQLTDDLIDDAIPRDSSHCMIAEAVKAAVPDARRVSVDIQTIRFTIPGKHLRYTYLTPRSIQLALLQFDQGQKPVPTSVVLRNGQVTYAGSRQSRVDREAAKTGKAPSAAQSKQRQNALKKAQDKADRARKLAKLSKQQLASTRGGEVPDRIGGQPPPTTSMGRRRAFGLRSMDH